jgi:hypothetical protein
MCNLRFIAVSPVAVKFENRLHWRMRFRRTKGANWCKKKLVKVDISTFQCDRHCVRPVVGGRFNEDILHVSLHRLCELARPRTSVIRRFPIVPVLLGGIMSAIFCTMYRWDLDFFPVSAVHGVTSLRTIGLERKMVFAGLGFKSDKVTGNALQAVD